MRGRPRQILSHRERGTLSESGLGRFRRRVDQVGVDLLVGRRVHEQNALRGWSGKQFTTTQESIRTLTTPGTGRRIPPDSLPNGPRSTIGSGSLRATSCSAFGNATIPSLIRSPPAATTGGDE